MADGYLQKGVWLGRYAARIVWVVVQLVLAYTLAGGFEPFFYQAF